MKKFGILLIGLAGVTISVDQPSAQSVVYGFQCVVTSVACIASLRANTTAIGLVVSAAGYYQGGDGGAGEFYDLGSASTHCANDTISSGNWSITATGSTTINFSPHITAANFTPGEALSGGGIQTGAEIASIDPSGNFLTMTLPATGTASGSLTISGDNAGTLIVDNESTAQCWQKTDYRGDPHEWGAKGNGTVPDDTALQNWLGAYGNLFGGAPAIAPPAFGPWEATIPANYVTNTPLMCPPNANLRAPANDSRESTVAPVVQISAGTGFPSGGTLGQYAVLTAQTQCRISGLSIDALVTSGSGSNNNFVDAVHIAGKGVVIDSHTILQHGYYNLYCTGGSEAGLQLKDSQFNQSWSDNVHVEQCANVRMIGDIFASAGSDAAGTAPSSQASVYFSGDDLTMVGGVVEQALGAGITLNGAQQVSITGMYIDTNGQSTTGSDFPGILINSAPGDLAYSISICGNHFHQNDAGGSSSTAHIRFEGPSSGNGAADNISLCGNVYLTSSTATPYPLYVYDVTGMPPTHITLYENPAPQQNGVFSLGAATLSLEASQVPPLVPRNYLSGLTLTNDSGSLTTVVDIGKGAAADSTNSAMITNPGQCSVNMDSSTQKGLGYVDNDAPANASTTYFFYIIADASGTHESCIASESPTAPNLTHVGYTSPIYRMVGALYTTATAGNVVQFTQDGDTFYLQTSVTDIPGASGACAGTIGTAPKTCTLSVPCGMNATCTSSGIAVEAFGRLASKGTGTIEILASSLDQSDQTPNVFPNSPGNTSTSNATETAYPFRLYTNNGGAIRVRASSGGTIVNEETDGWIFHRLQ